MSTSHPGIQNLVRKLLASEPAGLGSSHGDAGPAVRACEKLRVPLTKLIGGAGFSSLLSRALALAKRQAPWLEALRVEADGSLSGFNNQQDSGAADTARHGGEVLVVELLGLLVTFIGWSLMLSLVREAWPDAAVDTMIPDTEETP